MNKMLTIICIYWRSFPCYYFIIIQESIYNALSLIYASIYLFDEKWKCELKHFQNRFMKPPFLLMESLLYIYIRFTFIIRFFRLHFLDDYHFIWRIILHIECNRDSAALLLFYSCSRYHYQ